MHVFRSWMCLYCNSNSVTSQQKATVVFSSSVFAVLVIRVWEFLVKVPSRRKNFLCLYILVNNFRLPKKFNRKHELLGKILLHKAHCALPVLVTPKTHTFTTYFRSILLPAPVAVSLWKVTLGPHHCNRCNDDFEA
jgi:hypothetical protein